jgi:pimeloyl-ACP methyl ester carboxylesterase
MPRLSPRNLILVGCCFIAYSAVFALAAETSPASLPATQVWLINTCCAPGCGDLEAGLSQITYSRLDESCGCGRWQASDATAFQASALPGVPTTVLVHGYGTNDDWAVRHGNEFYCLMRQRACGHSFRLVVWSWPAERFERRVRWDVQSKVCRSDAEAYYLARVLPTLPQGTPLSLVGYSLGCRTVSGALQLLAGGPVAGRSLAAEVLARWKQGGPRPIRLMMVAAAMDANWLEACCPGGLAPLAVERILVSTNSRDSVLKWYSRLYGPHGPEAMGYTGPQGMAGGKLEVVDVTCAVGRKHDFDRYNESAPIYQRLAWYTFLCDAPAKE